MQYLCIGIFIFEVKCQAEKQNKQMFGKSIDTVKNIVYD
jgi:hypothetical protein